MRRALRHLAPLAALAAAACGDFTDPATRLAFDIERAAGRLGAAEGARYTLVHATPSRPGQCDGPYRVQLDAVGAIIIWCRNSAGATISSSSTSTHASTAATAHTIILDKPAGAPLHILLERRNGHPTITAAN